MLLEQASGFANELTAGGILAAVLAAFKYLDHRKGQKREENHKSASQTQLAELRGIRDTMSMGFETIDRRVTDLKTDFGRELGEVKERVKQVEGDIEEIRRVDRERLERKVSALDRRTGT